MTKGMRKVGGYSIFGWSKEVTNLGVIQFYMTLLLLGGLAGCSTLQDHDSAPLYGHQTAIPKSSIEVSGSGIKPVSGRRDVKGEHDKKSGEQSPVNITPLSSYTDEWGYDGAAGGDFSDAYTRLLILSDIPASNGLDDAELLDVMSYEKRGWLARYFVGRDFSINLTANITVGGFESTVPLATVGHVSDSNGEQWSRVIHHAKANFPLFLVRADGSSSVPVVKLSVNGTQSYASRGAASAVQVALGVARATAGPTSVITRLSEQSTKDKARAVDDAISKLFSSGVTEEHWTDRDLRFWKVASNNRPQGVRIIFNIPSDVSKWNSKSNEVGSWVVTFDHPRPSIFSDWRICPGVTFPRCATDRPGAEKAVHKEIDIGQVLNYKLTNDTQGLGSIKAVLSQQDWYTSAQVELAKKGGEGTAATSFCKRVINEVAGLGLNGLDAKIVLWAVVKGMPLPNDIDYSKVDGCKSLIATIENDRA